MLSRLQVTLLASLLASSVTAIACPYSMYYLDGLNRGDGMSSSIDLESGHMRVTSTLFDANACSDGRLCFTSQYMTFAAPPTIGREEWAAAGHQFKLAGTCTSRSGEAAVVVTVIRSHQKYGDFEYRYDATRNVLLGWTLSYLNEDGSPAADIWQAEGWSVCR